jgi:hypothetical protein
MQPQQANAAITLLFLFSGNEVDANPIDWSLTSRVENGGRELSISQIQISDPLDEQSEWSMCGAVDDTVLTTIYYGPCNTTTQAPPLGYYRSDVTALALIEGGDTAYLDSSDLATLVIPNGEGERITGGKSVDDANLVYSSVSVLAGDCNTFGAYLGTTSYLTLDGNATVTENTILLNGFSAEAVVDSVMYSPGSYKFSLFGVFCGSGYADFIASTDFTHLAFRTLLSQQGCDSADGCTWSPMVKQASSDTYQDFPATGESVTDVEAIEIVASDTDSNLTWTMDIRFPRTYRYGYATEDGSEYNLVDEGGESMSITMTVGNGSVYLDYLFPITHLNESLKYFIYDPEVSSTTTTTATTVAAATAAAAATTTAAAATAAATAATNAAAATAAATAAAAAATTSNLILNTASSLSLTMVTVMAVILGVAF